MASHCDKDSCSPIVFFFGCIVLLVNNQLCWKETKFLHQVETWFFERIVFIWLFDSLSGQQCTKTCWEPKAQWREVQEASKASEDCARNASCTFSGASTTTAYGLSAASAQATQSAIQQLPWIPSTPATTYNALHACWLCTLHASPTSFPS
jgi:hypothetical protein